MKNEVRIICLTFSTLCFISGCEPKCPSNPMDMLKMKGTLEVKFGLEDPTVTLWETYQARNCNVKPIAGSAQEEEEGGWYGVIENKSGDLMVLVEIKDIQSNEKKIAWLNCDFVELIESEIELVDLEKDCFK